MRSSFLLTAIFLSVGHAQNPIGFAGGSEGVLLCNQTFADANGTGIYYYNPHIAQGSGAGPLNETDGTTLATGLAVTIVAGQNASYQTQVSLWLSTGGADYTNDLGLGFDVCGIAAGPFSHNVNARGLKDDGSCSSMLGSPCINALQTLAQNYALELTFTASPGPNSNLSATSLPGICGNIQNKLNQEMPAECVKPFEGGASFALNAPLTGPFAYYNQSCSLNDTWYHIAAGFGRNNSRAVYDNLTETVAPVMLVYMPVANAQRQEFVTESVAKLFCGRVNHYNEGSTPPSNLPTPTSVGEAGGLSGGAIAGIVIGAVVGVGLIAGAVWFLVFKRKRKNAQRQAHEMDGGPLPKDGLDRKYTALSEADGVDTTMTELPTWSNVHEVHGEGSHRAELHSWEPSNKEAAVELEATSR